MVDTMANRKNAKKIAVKNVKQYNGLTNIEFKKHHEHDVILAEATNGYDYAMIDAKELYEWLKKRYEKPHSSIGNVNASDDRHYSCMPSFF